MLAIRPDITSQIGRIAATQAQRVELEVDAPEATPTTPSLFD